MDFRDEGTCAQRTERVRALNDQLRETGLGGKLFITQAVESLPPQVVAALMQAIREFDEFTSANDPYGEHDFGSVILPGIDQTFIWKLDVYDVNFELGSPDPADEAVSCRVLTVMDASEW